MVRYGQSFKNWAMARLQPPERAWLENVAREIGVGAERLERIRLTPEGCGVEDMRRLVKSLARAGNRVFTLTYHSPSLVPGHTPYVRTLADLEKFLQAIAGICEFFRDELGGVFMHSAQIRETMIGHHAQALASTLGRPSSTRNP